MDLIKYRTSPPDPLLSKERGVKQVKGRVRLKTRFTF